MNSDIAPINSKSKILLIRLGKLTVAILFILSAISKLISIGQFEIVIIQQHIVNNRLLAAYLARGVIILELFIGLSLLQTQYLKSLIYPITFAITSLFSLHLIYLIIFANYTENCGCFGELIKMTPKESLAKNVFLLIVISLLWLKSQTVDQKQKKPILLISFAIIPIIYVLMAFPINIITNSTVSESQAKSGTINQSNENLSRFLIFNQTKPDGMSIELTKGKCLVAFFSLDCDHCKEISEIMGDLNNRVSHLRMYCIFLGKEEQVEEFFEETYSNFPYLVVAPSQFFDFIGNAPPRIYSLSDGEILKFWDLDDFSIDEIENHALTH